MQGGRAARPGGQGLHGQELPGHIRVGGRQGPPAREGSTGESLAEAMASVRTIRGLGSPLLTPIVTPRWATRHGAMKDSPRRFVPTCSRELLAGLGELARREGLPVQVRADHRVTAAPDPPVRE